MNDFGVLIVDDEENVLRAISRMLRKEEYRLFTAGNGRDAMDILSRESIQLILTDQKMTGMSGTELLQLVKRYYPDTIRMVISGNADADMILEAVNQGEVYRFLTKPWTEMELKVTIRQCLERFELVQQNRLLTEELRRQNEELKLERQDLMQLVFERTRYLHFAQEVLFELPVPVLGVGDDGMLVLTNQQAMRELSFFKGLHSGADVREVLPRDLVEAIDFTLEQGMEERTVECSTQGRDMRVKIRTLKANETSRGCIMVFEMLPPSPPVKSSRKSGVKK